jgi:hypothetical protein
VLLFPDGQSLLQFVDQISASVERRSPMTGAHSDPHRDFSEFKLADPVSAADVLNFESRPGFRLNVLELRARYFIRAFIEKMENVLAFVPVPHSTRKGDEGAGDRIV